MTRTSAVAYLAYVIALLAACADASAAPRAGQPAAASSTFAPTSTPAPLVTPTPTVVPLFTRATEIKDAVFEPEFVVAMGTEVTWTNRDTVLHTVTAKDGSSDSNALARGDRYAKLFTAPGRWEFFCVLHRTMVGAVVVQ